MKYFFALALAISLVFFSCDSKDPIVGTWLLDKIETIEGSITADQLGNPTYSFMDNHKYAIKVMGSVQEGTWKIENGKLLLTLDKVPGQIIETTLVESKEEKLSYTTGEGQSKTTVSFIKMKEGESVEND